MSPILSFGCTVEASTKSLHTKSSCGPQVFPPPAHAKLILTFLRVQRSTNGRTYARQLGKSLHGDEASILVDEASILMDEASILVDETSVLVDGASTLVQSALL
jgi:hypothetical protein